MKTTQEQTLQRPRSQKQLAFVLSTAVLVIGASSVHADMQQIYLEDFNAYADGPLPGLGMNGWYKNALTTPPVLIQSGKAYATPDAGFAAVRATAFFPDLFSGGLNHGTLEFDLLSACAQWDFRIGPATFNTSTNAVVSAASSQFVTGQFGPYGGALDFFTSIKSSGNIQGTVPGSVYWDGTAAGSTEHYLFDFTRSGTSVTVNMFCNGNLMPQFTNYTYTVTDANGINSFRLSPTDYSGYPSLTAFDNLKVSTEVAAVPEPSSALLMVAGCGSLLARRRRQKIVGAV